MQSNKELRDEIIKYLTRYPILQTSKNKYKATAQKFNVETEYIRGIWRDIREKANPILTKKFISERQQNKDYLNIIIDTNTEVKTLADLLTVCDVDGSLWDVVSWACKKWDLGIKNKDEQIETKALYSVSAKFKPKSANTDLTLQKEIIKKELFASAPDLSIIDTFTEFRDSMQITEANRKKNCLLELCLFDPHFGKLAHAEESGKDDDLKITSAKYVAAIKDLISRVNVDSIERILLPIGNDMLNVDGNSNTTTAGTPQTVDSRFYKVVRSVKELLIDTINYLTSIAPVDVVVVKGNHDSETMFMIGEMLSAYYHNTSVVTIDNAPTYRKYYQYGNTGLMFTHGNEEPHQSLGLIFATERSELWADVKFRYCQIGHFHKNKKISYVSVDEFQGFSVQIIPSLSGNDQWHSKKGYASLRQAKAFLIDYNEGICGEFTHQCHI